MLKLTAIGNLGRDAEVKDVAGRKVIEFSIAHSERYTDRSGQQQERTTWVRCSYWRDGDRVGVAEYLKKGKQVYVEGIPQVSSYTTKEGQPGASLDLRVTSLELIGGRSEGGAPAQSGGMPPAVSGSVPTYGLAGGSAPGYGPGPAPRKPAPEPPPQTIDPIHDDLPF